MVSVEEHCKRNLLFYCGFPDIGPVRKLPFIGYRRDVMMGPDGRHWLPCVNARRSIDRINRSQFSVSESQSSFQTTQTEITNQTD